MTSELSISVPLILGWLWRCVNEGVLFPGSVLHIAELADGQLKSLTEVSLDEVSRDDLRHRCGSRVIPVAPLQVK
jgi:hypothetical protein